MSFEITQRVNKTEINFKKRKTSGQLSTRTIPIIQVLVLMSFFYWLVVVLVGSCPTPRDYCPSGK